MKLESLLTLPFVDYFRRNWTLVLIALGLLWVALDDSLFAVFGWYVYPPAIAFGSLALAALFRHIFHRNTTDAYTDNRQGEFGSYVDDFKTLPRIHKVWLTTIQWLVYVLAFCIVGALVAMK